MDTEMHENLLSLDLAIESLDPSPTEMLILFNHMLGGLAAQVDEHTWGTVLERGCAAVRESRSARP